jgi:ABC-type Zn uptake system ZnuABC Zn-binding protein ZnuA
MLAIKKCALVKKEPDLSDLSQKKFQKVLRKIEEMADVFLNSASFAKHTFLTLAPPSGYALNLKALIKVSKVS